MISIVIPFFNRIAYVKRAVLSVINQSYTDWEIILVDDCSLEKLNIHDFVQPEHYDKVRLITNKQNLGPGLSRQAGLNMAIGEYVCFLDSDDFYHRDFLLRTLNKLLLSPESAGVFCTTVSTKGGINRGSDQTASNIMPNLFLRNRPWSTSSWLWRKSEISEWKQLRTNEDWMFEIDTASINNSIVHIAEPLCIKDDDTGENTKDLVDYKTPEIHRDTVAKYALNKLNSYSNHQFYDRIKKAVIKRLVFTSSRLILLKEEREVRKNGLLIIRHNLPLALLLLLLSVTTFNSISIAGFYKRLLNRIHNVL